MRLPTGFLLLLATAAARAADPVPDFNRDVRPILSDKCFACHGPDAKHRKADLRLDVEKSARAAGAVVPGKPDESALIERITAKDAAERMPPAKTGKTLTPAEIETLRRWIAAGSKYAEHWAYVPPVRHPDPAVKDAAWPVSWLDRFVLARLEREGLRPSADAEAVTLARRLAFDLTGLPLTPEAVDSFLCEASAKPQAAIERLIDGLLASPHYGERMAMYWLDLVRYADTVGYHGDQEHHASPYRDYVIDAFNQNLPFDRFTREQLAGDLLPNPTVAQKIATCYNRLLQTSHEGGVQAKEYLAIYAADRVRNLSAVWMGATIGCAQCHDHRYDPYTLRDFYALSAFFADVDEEKHLRGGGADTTPTKRQPEITVTVRGVPRQVMVTQAVPPRTVRVLPRGNWLDESGPVVEPAVPAFLGKLAGPGRATRLDLANWLTDAKEGVGGLTARVFVNRVWYLFFGTGLCNSLEDFGGQGEPPTHPELLDRLATEFVASGWDVKHLVRRIVTSRAYRQASLANPQAGQQGRWRLPAEVIRDNALAVSGLLVLDVGGLSAKPYQPAGYYRHLNFPKREYVAHTDARQWRRGVYVHWQRQFLHPMLKAFDAPSREECTVRRPRSSTPLAALVLLNDPTFLEAARALGQRTLAEGGKTDPERVAFAFRQVTSRRPDAFEQDVLLRLLEGGRARYSADAKAAAELVRTGLAPVPAHADVSDLAAWTTVCRAVLNLNEAVTRE